MDLELEGKVELVTGGSRGIGATIAFCLAREGCDVAFNHWEDPEGAEETVVGVEGLGRRCIAHEADVAGTEEAERMVALTVRELGRLDILVNNAALASGAPVDRMTEQQWDRVLAVNLKGCFNYCRAVAERFREQRSGRIVNIASIAALRSPAGQANYAASKAGLIGLTRGLARELGPFGVTVNAVAPGTVESDVDEALPEQLRGPAAARAALDRLASPVEVANVVAFLCSERAAGVTGEVVRVDAGQSI